MNVAVNTTEELPGTGNFEAFTFKYRRIGRDIADKRFDYQPVLECDVYSLCCVRDLEC
jgi:hypothetical protein